MTKINGTQARIETLEKIVANQSALLARRELAGQLGLQFSGDREIYKEAGYPTGEINYEKYYGKYLRQDIANRIVKAPVKATWRRAPELWDGETIEDARDDTPFCRQWRQVATIDQGGLDKKSVWHYLQRADKLAGIGQFAVLLLGLDDGRELSEPLETAKNLLYLSPYSEGEITISDAQLVTDTQSARFGLPEIYRLNLGVGVSEASVHWTRVVHVADELLTGDIYGEPRLEAVFNRLEDLEKIMPAAAEAAWKLLYQGVVVTSRDGYSMPDGEVTTTKLDEYVHKLRRVLELEGADVQVLGGEMVDPSGLVDTILDFISATTNIPKRILLGSERGELASSQDERNWATYIMNRQTEFAEPVILRPLIDRLLFAGVLPPPASGNYLFKWPNQFELTELQQADLQDKKMAALQKAVQSGIPLEFYLRHYEQMSEDQINELLASPEYQARLAVLDMGLANNG